MYIQQAAIDRNEPFRKNSQNGCVPRPLASRANAHGNVFVATCSMLSLNLPSLIKNLEE